MAWVDREGSAGGDNVDGCLNVREVQSAGDALGVQVEREGDEVDVSGAPSVPEQTSFKAVCPC